MRRIYLCLFACLMFQAFCHADVTKLPTNVRAVLQDNKRFHEIHGTTNLPPSVFAYCADYRGRLAEPGQGWEPTDAISEKDLPGSRLIWAVTDGTYYVVHYERGGYGHSLHALVIELKAGESKPVFTWHASASAAWSRNGGPLKNYSAFLQALQEGTLDDSFEDIESNIRAQHQ